MNASPHSNELVVLHQMRVFRERGSDTTAGSSNGLAFMDHTDDQQLYFAIQFSKRMPVCEVASEREAVVLLT